MIRFSFELIPESRNTINAGHTQKLDELNKLQRSIFMGFGHIKGHQVVQSLNDLTENKTFYVTVSCYKFDLSKIYLQGNIPELEHC